MTINYKIDENDFLAYQLLAASKSDRIRKKRQRSKVTVLSIYAALGLLFFYQEEIFLTIVLFLIGLLWFFIYPIRERNRYVKHYQGFIKENYQGRLGRIANLELSNDHIIAKDNGNESKILTTELEEINEISTAIFVRLKGGQSIILPKEKIINIDNVKIFLKELAANLKIKYHVDENWKWK